MYEEKWLPIETAPRDGTVVLLIFEDGDIACAYGAPNYNGWWALNGMDFDREWENPIGWLPRDVLPKGMGIYCTSTS